MCAADNDSLTLSDRVPDKRATGRSMSGGGNRGIRVRNTNYIDTFVVVAKTGKQVEAKRKGDEEVLGI